MKNPQILIAVFLANLIMALPGQAQDRVIIRQAPSADALAAMLFDAAPPAHIKMRGIKMHKPLAETSPSTSPTVVAAPVKFAFNSSDIPTGFRPTLNNLATAMQTPAAHTRVLVVTGHTDPFGSAEYNLDLSRQRAEAVRRYLAARGVPADRIKTVGMGENALLSHSNHDLNRRVEFQAFMENG